MAEPTVRSSTYRWGNTENPHLAQKPAGLAVGDLLVIYVASDGSGFPSSGPAGFTQVVQTAQLTSHNGTLYAKIADAGDVAAANYPIGNSGGKRLFSITWAVIGGSVVGSIAGGSTTSLQTHTAVCDITPPSANSLILWGVVSGGSSSIQYQANGAAVNGFVNDQLQGPWWIYRGGHAPWLIGNIASLGVRMSSSCAVGFCAVVIANPQPADSDGRYNRMLNPRVKNNLTDGFSLTLPPDSYGSMVRSTALPPGFSAWPATTIDACLRSASSANKSIVCRSPVVPGRVYRASSFIGAGTYYTDVAYINAITTGIGTGWTWYRQDGTTVVPVNPYIDPVTYRDPKVNGQWWRAWSQIVAAPPLAAWLEWILQTGSLGSTAEGRRMYFTGFMLEEGSGPLDIAMTDFSPALASCYGDGATPGWSWVD